MNFFESFKNFKNKLDKVESTVYSGSDSLLEVYEKNAKLEAEIVARTKELDRANRQMLTLQHIWEMMNSSKPLSSVLNAIVNSLQGELGYLYSFIVKERNDNDGKYLQIVASSRDEKVPSTVKSKQGGNTYNNFDTDGTLYSYTPDAAADVPSIVMAKAGRQGGGDFDEARMQDGGETA